MYIPADTLDDLLRDALQTVLDHGVPASPTRGGIREVFGVLLHLKNPRARLSRTESRSTLASALGELVWYLSRENRLDFIEYYAPRYRENSDDGTTVHGGYGPRLFSMRGIDQVQTVITLLGRNPGSRRAVIQLLDAEDVNSKHVDIPCTAYFQFVVRSGQLHMLTTMRSNDVYMGLPHDVFAFTMIQEIVARSLNLDIGTYKHAVGSLHLYDDAANNALRFLEEGWQESSPGMPAMPAEVPWPAIEQFREIEQRIRMALDVESEVAAMAPYWQDLLRLLQLFSAYKARDLDRMRAIAPLINDQVYSPYVQKKILDLEEKLPQNDGET